jgi:hypothetical protein
MNLNKNNVRTGLQEGIGWPLYALHGKELITEIGCRITVKSV